MPSLKSLGLGSHRARGDEIIDSEEELRKLSAHNSGTITVEYPDGSWDQVNTLVANMDKWVSVKTTSAGTSLEVDQKRLKDIGKAMKISFQQITDASDAGLWEQRKTTWEEFTSHIEALQQLEKDSGSRKRGSRGDATIATRIREVAEKEKVELLRLIREAVASSGFDSSCR